MLKRFKDLEEVVPREATRAARLRELEKEDLIKAEIATQDGRRVIAYSLTPKGEKIAALAVKLANCLKSES